jgi:hypothetical protein
MTCLVMSLTPFVSDDIEVGVNVTVGDGEPADPDRLEAVDTER